MEEDEVVDILGDFNLESLLLNKKDAQMLCYDGGIGCDYSSVSSQWILDTTTSHSWYDKNENVTHCSNQFETTVYDSFGWTDKEKYLLEKGLELFGQSWSRLSQYIGSKMPHQVKNYMRNGAGSLLLFSPSSDHQFSPPVNLDFTTEVGGLSDDIRFAEIIEDMEIPASMEEVITVVSTAHPTVQSAVPKLKQRPCSLRPKVKKQRRIAKNDKLIRTKTNQSRRRPKGPRNFNVIKEKPKFKPANYKAVCRVNRNEEIVKIRYEETSEDSDVDIEDSNEFVPKPKLLPISEEVEDIIITVEDNGESGESSGGGTVSCPSSDNKPARSNRGSNLDDIYRLARPEKELEIDADSVGDEEMALHPEFFANSKQPDKLRSRYLKIRNHIIDSWQESKPNYVTKTSVRAGLKNCGDVNLIGRIHAYLEQIGAINFGCEQCHYNMKASGSGHDDGDNMADSTDKDDSCVMTEVIMRNGSVENENTVIVNSPRVNNTRSRRKRVWSPAEQNGVGGLTMVHDSTGAVTQVTHIYDRSATGDTNKKKQNKMKKLGGGYHRSATDCCQNEEGENGNDDSNDF